MKPETFDDETAVRIQQGVAGSSHDAYKDGAGSISLLCIGTSKYGGAALNKRALRWLQEQLGNKFIRFMNEKSGFDVTIPLLELPGKDWREGKFGGEYAYFDVCDFIPPAASYPPSLNGPRPQA
jgi:hypothetical protein